MKNYASRVFPITLLVVAILTGICFVPRFKVGNLSVKRANIYSDLVELSDESAFPEADAYFDTTFLAEGAELPRIEERLSGADSAVSVPAVVSEAWELEEPVVSEKPVAAVAAATGDVIPVEEFAVEGVGGMSRFYAALGGGKKTPVRIAVLGDSFIEGDIFTADLRERLQDRFGGTGGGFIPFASAVAKFRGTISHEFSGWNTVSIRDPKSKKAAFGDRFFISGLVCLPQEGATVTLKGVNFRKHLQEVSVARFLFVNRGSTRIEITVNGKDSRIFTPEPDSTAVQEIVVRGAIRSLSASFSRTEGFIGYGIMLEDGRGVSVDNYSVRGNSGLGLLETNYRVNMQVDRLIGGYDLVVLQYGLNVMSPEVSHYGAYGKKFRSVIDYMKYCFPSASVLVLGVGDRSTQQNGEFRTMPGVAGMLRAQREAAEATGTAFWNTFRAMGGENAMVRFVEKNWAAKDYTHIGYAGGRYIAGELAEALVRGAQGYSGAEYGVRNESVPDSVSAFGTDSLSAVRPAAGEEEVPDTGIRESLSADSSAGEGVAVPAGAGNGLSVGSRSDSLSGQKEGVPAGEPEDTSRSDVSRREGPAAVDSLLNGGGL